MKNSSCTCLLSMKYICEPFLIYNHRKPLTLICRLQMEIKWEIKTYLFCSWICCGSKVKWKLFSRMQKQCSFNFAFALSQHSQLSNQSCFFLSSNPTVSLTQRATWAKEVPDISPRFSHLFPPPMMQRWCGRIINRSQASSSPPDCWACRWASLRDEGQVCFDEAKMLWLSWILLLFLAESSSSAKILGGSAVGGSHYMVIRNVMEELAARGHEVLIILTRALIKLM